MVNIEEIYFARIVLSTKNKTTYQDYLVKVDGNKMSFYNESIVEIGFIGKKITKLCNEFIKGIFGYVGEWWLADRSEVVNSSIEIKKLLEKRNGELFQVGYQNIYELNVRKSMFIRDGHIEFNHKHKFTFLPLKKVRIYGTDVNNLFQNILANTKL